MIVLDAHATGSLTLTGRADLATNGNVYVNSDASQAARLTGNAQVSAASVFVHGGDSLTGNSQLHASVQLNANTIVDPLAQLSVPSESGLNRFGYTKLSGGSVSLSPGVYTSAVNISGQANVTLKPGTYIFENGLQVSGGASITGDNVFIYVKGGSLSFTGNSSVNLTANSIGDYKGITIYQASSNSNAANFTGCTGWSLGGALYAPSATINMTGGTHASSPSVRALIVNQLNMTGGSTWIGQ